MKRGFVIGFALCYLMGGLSFGLSASRAMPFVTLAGDCYYGALWPLAPLSVYLNRQLYPIPPWAINAGQPGPSAGDRDGK